MAHGILHQGPHFEAKFTLVQAGEQVGQTVFENFEQGEGERVAHPLQFDQAQRGTTEMDEVDAAFDVGVRVGDARGDGTLVEPARHVPLVGEYGDSLLEQCLGAPVVVPDVRCVPAAPELLGGRSGLARQVVGELAVEPLHEPERGFVR